MYFLLVQLCTVCPSYFHVFYFVYVLPFVLCIKMHSLILCSYKSDFPLINFDVA
jgi:hypothetical protein